MPFPLPPPPKKKKKIDHMPVVFSIIEYAFMF